FEQVEGAEVHVAAHGCGAPCLAINQTGDRLERVQCLDNKRKPFGPIVPISGEKQHASGPTPRQEPEAIMLFSRAVPPAAYCVELVHPRTTAYAAYVSLNEVRARVISEQAALPSCHVDASRYPRFQCGGLDRR